MLKKIEKWDSEKRKMVVEYKDDRLDVGPLEKQQAKAQDPELQKLRVQNQPDTVSLSSEAQSI